MYILGQKKKNEILPFTTTWMDLDGIMLSEKVKYIKQRKTNTVFVHEVLGKKAMRNLDSVSKT